MSEEFTYIGPAHPEHPMSKLEERIREFGRTGVLHLPDDVNHPAHYKAHPSGVECIQITEHMTFNLGNAVKYIWRAGLKSPDAIKDLRKAVFYVNREIERLEGGAGEPARAKPDRPTPGTAGLPGPGGQPGADDANADYAGV